MKVAIIQPQFITENNNVLGDQIIFANSRLVN